MTNHIPTLDRRSVLRGAVATGTVALAGCLTSGTDGDTAGTPTATETDSNVTLPPPENIDAIREADVGYPIHGDELPDVTVPAPLQDRQVSTREFVGDRHVLLTFVYTRCGSICPALTANLVHVQADAADRGYSEDVALLPMTFDPEHDHAEQLRQFGEERGADLSAGNWYFLRPDGVDRVQEIVVETFGHPFQENPGEGMPFLHNPMLILANKRGYVERTYTNKVPNASTVIDDVRTLTQG